MSLNESEHMPPSALSAEKNQETHVDADQEGEEREQKKREPSPFMDDKDENDPWRIALDMGKESDKELIDNWKDEMNNLLIFAGLFSAVVTAFTVESYQWLQADPEDPSVPILTRISEQLSSFNTPSGLINSTASPLAPSTSSPSGPPAAIPINILWFISLTLSLVSAFYAITVQQWLRQLTIPRYLIPRDAARLRQRRYDSLIAWQVPSIIALLPLLLQVAVILFLVGLLVLLHSLNHVVASAFTAVAGISLILFAVTVFLPVIDTWCPYKSPVIPSILAVLQWCITPLSVPAFLLLGTTYLTSLVISLALALLVVIIFWSCIEEDRIDDIFDQTFATISAMLDLCSEYLVKLFNPTTIGLERFWTDQEIKLELGQEADIPVLSQAVAAATGSSALQLRRVLAGLPSILKIQCTLLAVATTIRLRQTINLDNLDSHHQFHRMLFRLVHTRANTPLHDDHVTLMVEVLSLDWSAEDWIERDSAVAPLLLLLHLATLIDKLPSPKFFRILTGARSCQKISAEVTKLTLHRRIPTVLMCIQLHSSDDLDIDQELALSMIAWATQGLEAADASWMQPSIDHYNSYKEVPRIIDFIFAASAVAFKALSRRPGIISINRSDVKTFLSSLDHFLDKNLHRIIVAIELLKSKRERFLLFAIKEATEMMCKSLADLATSRHLPLDANCASMTIADRLQAICKNKDEYDGARDDLEQFKNVVGPRTVAARHWRRALPNILAATRIRRRVPRNAVDASPRSVTSALETDRAWAIDAAGARHSLVPCHSLAPMRDLLLRDGPALPPRNDASDKLSRSIGANGKLELSMTDGGPPVTPSDVITMPALDYLPPVEIPLNGVQPPFVFAESVHDIHDAAQRATEVDESPVPSAAGPHPSPSIPPEDTLPAREAIAQDSTLPFVASLECDVGSSISRSAPANVDTDGSTSSSGLRAAGATRPPLLPSSFALPTPELTPMHEV